MASTGRCEYCNSTISSDQQNCPNCGAANPNYVAEMEHTVFLPKTIEELKEYCAQRGMPLLRMRFFIGEDFKEPKAFGIYRDGDDVVVYKNKADGTRAIRYKGPDEEHAVNELFAKLMEECHNRGIYPDGKPEGTTRSGTRRSSKYSWQSVLAYLAILLIIILFLNLGSCGAHKHDGYYRFNDEKTYYRYGDDWYYTWNDSYSEDWYEIDTVPVSGDTEPYYLEDDFDSDWGISNFKNSAAWDEIQENNSNDNDDYDDWDAGDTDWDTDW